MALTASIANSGNEMSEKSFVSLLSRLVTKQEYRRTQDQLSDLLDHCYRNSWEENSSFCCELIRHHASLQGYLFQLLKFSTEQERSHGRCESLRTKLLPWLCSGFVCSGNQGEEIASLHEEYESKIEQLEDQLEDAEKETTRLQTELQQATVVMENCNEEIHKMKDNAIELKRENSVLYRRLNKTTPEPLTLNSSSNSSHENLHIEELNVNELSPVRNEFNFIGTASLEIDGDCAGRLVKRFGEIYSDDRLVLMGTLEGLNDRETNERLVFRIVEECFNVAKKEQEKMKSRMTQALQPLSGDMMDEQRVEEIVDNFMKKNTENYNTGALLSDVFNSVRRKYSSPSSVFQNETLLSEFTRVVMNVAWHMVALDPPVVTASAVEGDIITETRYRRSYMSEFSSTIIHHYIWPCVLRRGRILTKGELVTRRIPVYDQKIPPKSHTRSQSAETSLKSLAFKGNRFGSSSLHSLGIYDFREKHLSQSWNGSV